MCFSAGASFGASALLIGAGIIANKRIESPNMRVFACMPILFGVQQFSEGILWLSFSHSAFIPWHLPAIYFFLVFAQIVWPVWVPLSVWLMEPDRQKKKIIFYFLGIGVVISSYLIYCLFAYEVSAFVEQRHIRYGLHFPNLNLRIGLYFLATVPPLFFSSLRNMKLLGATALGSLILSYIFFYHYVISVWCFFAAVLSVLVYVVITSNKTAPDRAFLNVKGHA